MLTFLLQYEAPFLRYFVFFPLYLVKVLPLRDPEMFCSPITAIPFIFITLIGQRENVHPHSGGKGGRKTVTYTLDKLMTICCY